MVLSALIGLLLFLHGAEATFVEASFVLHQDDTVEFKGLMAREGEPRSQPVSSQAYQIHLKDTEGSVVEKKNLKVSFVDFHSRKTIEEIPLVVPFLYREDIRTIELYHGATLIFSRDLGESLCNHDGACAGQENFLLCKGDCPSGSEDSWCDKKPDGRCDPDCADGVDADCTTVSPAAKEGNQQRLLLGGIIFLIILGIILWKAVKR